MTPLLTIHALERAEPRLRLGASTLPLSFAYSDGSPDVVGLVGDGDWIAAVEDAVGRGARGILVVDPSPDSPERLAVLGDLLAAEGVPLVLDRGWASSPSVESARGEFAVHAVPGAMVESRVDSAVPPDGRAALLQQLALVRAAVAPVAELRLVRLDETGYDGLGALEGGAALSLSHVVSAALAESADVRTVRQEATVLLELGPVDIAVPGRLRVLEGGAERSVLTPYETPHRNAWRRLHAAVTAGANSGDLSDFRDDVTLVDRAITAFEAR